MVSWRNLPFMELKQYHRSINLYTDVYLGHINIICESRCAGKGEIDTMIEQMDWRP